MPVVVSIALIASIVWLALGKDFAFALSIFTTVLIIACPCALGLAIPLSTIAGVAKVAEFGILVRNIEALQAASEIDTLVFDKTGTLTTGEMQVVSVENYQGFAKEKLLNLAYSLEQQASHPVAKAIVKFAQQSNAQLETVENVEVTKGLGISGNYQEQHIKIGNAAFIGIESKNHAKQDFATLVYLSLDDVLIGQFSLADQLRPEAKAIVQQCQQAGYHCLMLTGDRQTSAEYFAAQLGLNGVIAEVLPDQKADKIRQLQAQGRKVAMIGDGINDAPALAQAHVGIAMHQGSDIAMETADLSLMQPGLTPVAKVLPFSQRVLMNMKQSLLGAFIYNIIAIPVAAGVLYPFTGWLLNPMIAAIAMAMSSITVVLNSQRLLKD